MTPLNQQVALVTGGSRGLGRGIVEALAAQGVKVWALARNGESLDKLKQDIKGVQTLAADMSHAETASQAMHQIRPNILVLNAGATPTPASFQEQTWEEFCTVWDTDVKSTFYFGREALLMPMAPGSTIIIVSSGAALNASVLLGSYSGAKRTQWFMGQHLQYEVKRLNLGIRVVVLVPMQIVSSTDFGQVAKPSLMTQHSLTEQQYAERFKAPVLTPDTMGQGVISLLTNETDYTELTYGITGQGLAAL